MCILLLAMGNADKALSFYQQSLDMRRKLHPASKYPDGHPGLALSLNSLGAALQVMGQAEKALCFYQESLDMRRKLYPASKYPDGHPDLAVSLDNLGVVLKAMGQEDKALSFYQESLDMARKLYPASKYPDGHPDLATSLTNLGGVLWAMGQGEKALSFLQESLDMKRKLYPAAKYPDGHPNLAVSLNNLAVVLREMGHAEKALSFQQDSLDMMRKVYPASKYPDGHPDFAVSLNSLGAALQMMGQADKAISFYQESLNMTRKLYPASRYPDGHPHIAVSLNNVGSLLLAIGQAEKALSIHEQSLDMARKLYPASKYPDGHPFLATSLSNLGRVLEVMGQPEQALPFARQSLGMQQKQLKRELLTASEAAALERIATEPLYRDAYLSLTRELGLLAGACYADMAPSRAMVTRLLEQRHATLRAAGTAAAKFDELKRNRRLTEQRLQDTRITAEERDKLLAALADERDKLERELLDAMPVLKRWRDLDRLGPDELVKALPAGAVFIDLISYTRFAYDRGKDKRVPNYVAFVLGARAPQQDEGRLTIQRIELAESLPIDRAIAAWRNAIAAGKSSPAAAELARLVWQPLAKHLPSGTKTLYIAADSDLARVPWAALPTGKDRVLLEDYAIAQVPHGTFLLDQLKFPRTFTSPKALLTLGDVDYGRGRWDALPGTRVEVDALRPLAPVSPTTLTGANATPLALALALGKVRYAHLATHGEFQAEALAAEKQRAALARATRQLGDESRNVAAKNPLGYVGLVLANGEIMSGLSIVDLPLENLKLVTLSACETGLGEFTAGEGVQGLQRAFHVAGCPNVVASLWKVNDDATAALMTQFYHELWVNKQPPIESLRTAQLTIYRHPERIPILARERGIRVDKVAALPPGANLDGKQTAAVGRTDTRLWAAFVLSGLGK
jgi:CHAT domain-containing protein/uncharacterized glyoxalase superfamily protein PhnB